MARPEELRHAIAGHQGVGFRLEGDTAGTSCRSRCGQ